jgi:hypothetical protein
MWGIRVELGANINQVVGLREQWIQQWRLPANIADFPDTATSQRDSAGKEPQGPLVLEGVYWRPGLYKGGDEYTEFKKIVEKRPESCPGWGCNLSLLQDPATKGPALSLWIVALLGMLGFWICLQWLASKPNRKGR